jgi:putative tricarboxylic transport membrane protein
METLQGLLAGFAIALMPQNLLFALLGSLIGTLIGVLPGIGTAAGTAILLPLTFQLPPTGAIIMLAAIYYGAQYGGTITSVLMSVPGEVTSVVTVFDGHPMALQGRGGVALSIAAIGSFVGGTVATAGLVIAALPLTRMALRFGPPEQFALMALGLSLIFALASASVVKTLMVGTLGLLLAMVGMDPALGVPRFDFGQPELMSGLDFVAVTMGLFGVSDILLTAERKLRPVVDAKLSSLWPTREDLRQAAGPMARGSLLGFCLGLIPGMQPSIATFMSYITEKKLSKHSERFGAGAIQGVAGPETTNNAFVNAALIPLFTLSIPTTPTIAVLMGAFMMNGLAPGPLLFREHPDVVWAVIASLYVGNLILLVLNLPLIGIWVRLLTVPYSILLAVILVFTLIGSYSLNGRVFDMGVAVAFGIVGYLLTKFDFPLAPMVLTLVLGPLMERALRASLQMSGGSFGILFSRPISATLLAVAALFLVASALQFLPFKRAASSRGED